MKKVLAFLLVIITATASAQDLLSYADLRAQLYVPGYIIYCGGGNTFQDGGQAFWISCDTCYGADNGTTRIRNNAWANGLAWKRVSMTDTSAVRAILNSGHPNVMIGHAAGMVAPFSLELTMQMSNGVAKKDTVQMNGISSAIAAKYNTPTGNTSQVVLGDGTLGTLPVVNNTTVNTAIGYVPVPPTRTVNGQPLSGNVVITKNDVNLPNVQNVDQTNASNITSGTIAPARMGTGTPNSSTVLYGNGIWGTLPAGNKYLTGLALNVVSGNQLQIVGTMSDATTVTSNAVSVPTGFGYNDTAFAAGARSLNTAYMISATKYSEITINVQAAANLSLTGGQTGTLTMQISPNGTSGWIDAGKLVTGNTGTLTIGLNTTQTGAAPLDKGLKPGWYWRVVDSGTGTLTLLNGSYRVFN